TDMGTMRFRRSAGAAEIPLAGVPFNPVERADWQGDIAVKKGNNVSAGRQPLVEKFLHLRSVIVDGVDRVARMSRHCPLMPPVAVGLVGMNYNRNRIRSPR